MKAFGQLRRHIPLCIDVKIADTFRILGLNSEKLRHCRKNAKIAAADQLKLADENGDLCHDLHSNTKTKNASKSRILFFWTIQVDFMAACGQAIENKATLGCLNSSKVKYGNAVFMIRNYWTTALARMCLNGRESIWIMKCSQKFARD